MSNRDEIPSTIHELTEKLLNGTISDEGVRTLERELRGNPANQKFFHRYCRIHVNLAMDLRAEHVLEAFRQQQDAQKQLAAKTGASPPLPGFLGDGRQPMGGGEQTGGPTPGSHALSSMVNSLAELPARVRRFARATAMRFHLGRPPAPRDFDRDGRLPLRQDDASPVARWPWFASGGLLGMILTMTLLLWPRPLDPAATLHALTATRPATAADTPIAFLRNANGCEWGPDGPALDTIGSSVRSGDEITLNQGIAEFTLASGVTLSIEGPASLLITSPTSLALQYGTLTTYVPWTVTDFKALAGGCRMTACDAEFGVRVEGSSFDIHVFSGEVRAVSSIASDAADVQQFDEAGSVLASDRGAFVKGVITAGRALYLANKDRALCVERTGKALPSQFAAKLSMAGRLPITKAYVDAVTKSHPLAYWRFESFEGGVVPNEVPDGCDLKIFGNLRRAGHADNHVAEFQPSANSYLESSETLDALAKSDYSIELWVKPSHLHRGTLLMLYSRDPKLPHGSGLELQGTSRESLGAAHSGEIRFVHHNPFEGGDRRIGTSCLSKKPYDARRWQHVVAVKGGAQMRLYVDGALAGTTTESKQLASGLRAMLGRNFDVGTRNRDFVGQLDELALYTRALGAEEILRHYNAVHWTPQQQP
jgi:Concanavalin A-like lectin/glucanases superfamily